MGTDSRFEGAVAELIAKELEVVEMRGMQGCDRDGFYKEQALDGSYLEAEWLKFFPGGNRAEML